MDIDVKPGEGLVGKVIEHGNPVSNRTAYDVRSLVPGPRPLHRL